jgi:hypothetical protein
MYPKEATNHLSSEVFTHQNFPQQIIQLQRHMPITAILASNKELTNCNRLKYIM